MVEELDGSDLHHKQKFSQSELIPAESLQINIAFPVFRYEPKKLSDT